MAFQISATAATWYCNSGIVFTYAVTFENAGFLNCAAGGFDINCMWRKANIVLYMYTLAHHVQVSVNGGQYAYLSEHFHPCAHLPTLTVFESVFTVCLLLLLSYTWWLVCMFLGNLAPLGSRDCEFTHFLAIILLPVKEFILKLERDEIIDTCFSN